MSAKSPFSVAKSPFVMVTAPFLCIECPCFLVQSHVRVVFDPSSIPSFESELTVNQINPNKCHANLWWIHHNFAASNSHITTTPFPNLLKAYWHDALVLQHGPVNGHLIKCYLASAIPALAARLRVMGRSPAAPRVPRWSPCRWPKSKKAVGSVVDSSSWIRRGLDVGWSARDLIGKLNHHL